MSSDESSDYVVVSFLYSLKKQKKPKAKAKKMPLSAIEAPVAAVQKKPTPKKKTVEQVFEFFHQMILDLSKKDTIRTYFIAS
jgi:hypothetical protein